MDFVDGKPKLFGWNPVRIQLACLLLTGLFVLGVDRWVETIARPFLYRSVEETPEAHAAVVLGAGVYSNGVPSPMLADRLETGVALYRAGKVKKLLLSGDHGRRDYDEVNAMRDYVARLGIPWGDIFMDHAGFSTYDSMYRARDVFLARDVIIVTQEFHLPRAVFTARALGLNATGVAADRQPYGNTAYLRGREVIARAKAFLQVYVLRSVPKFLGPSIPIIGDGRVTVDRQAGHGPATETAPELTEVSPVTWTVAVVPVPGLTINSRTVYLAPPYTFRIEFSAPVDRDSVETAIRNNLWDAADLAMFSFAWTGDREVTLTVADLPQQTKSLLISPYGGRDREGNPLSAREGDSARFVARHPGGLWRYRQEVKSPPITRFGQPYEVVSASPDGKRLFLRLWVRDTRPVGPTPGLGYLYDLRTGVLARLGTLDGWIFALWTPDGGLLAWGQSPKTETLGYEGQALYIDPDGRQSVLHHGAQVIEALVDPGSRRAALFLQSGMPLAPGGSVSEEAPEVDLLLVDFPTNKHRLYPAIAMPDRSPNDVPFLEAEWSPDGSVIAYRDAGGSEDGKWAVWLLDPASGERRKVAGEGVHLGWLRSWSPDGQHLFLAGVGVVDRQGRIVFRDDGPGACSWSPRGNRLFVGGVGLVDTHTWKVLRTVGRNNVHSSWSPDGLHLLVEEMGVLDSSGKLLNSAQLLDTARALWSPGGRHAYLPGLRMIVDVPTGKTRPLPADLGDPSLGRPEVVAWAADGETLLLAPNPD